MRRLALMVASIGCASCGRGFFNPDPQFQDAAITGSDSTPAGPAIAYVQGTLDQSSGDAIDTPIALLQHAGDTVVVSVAWYGSSITSVYDEIGDVYQSAVGPLLGTNNLKHQVFYSANVGTAPPGINHIHVMFNIATASTIGIIEYANVDPVNPVDVQAGKSGLQTEIPSSGEVITQAAGDLLVATIVSDGTLATTIPGYALRSQSASFVLEDDTADTAGAHAAIAESMIGATWSCSLLALRRN